MRYEINSVAIQNQASHLASNFAGACLVVDSKELLRSWLGVMFPRREPGIGAVKATVTELLPNSSCAEIAPAKTYSS
jgi:hypothetical protein